MLIILGFFTGALLAVGFGMMLQKPASVRRLERIYGETEKEARDLRAMLIRVLEPIAEKVGGASDELRTRLVQAGFRDEGALAIFVGLRVTLPLLLLATGFVAGNVLDVPTLTRLTLLGIGAGIGYVGPSFLLDKLRAKRQRIIRQALPDALDLMVVCLEAGVAMGACFGRVAREFSRTSPALCEELRLVTLEMQAGKSGADALRAFSDRIGIEDVSSLVAMLIQSEKFGTSVASALRIHTDGMRTERLQRAEERAQKAAVRMLFPAAGLIFPAIMIVLMGPAMIAMSEAFSR
jgi:tight adherence protein C